MSLRKERGQQSWRGPERVHKSVVSTRAAGSEVKAQDPPADKENDTVD